MCYTSYFISVHTDLQMRYVIQFNWYLGKHSCIIQSINVGLYSGAYAGFFPKSVT